MPMKKRMLLLLGVLRRDGKREYFFFELLFSSYSLKEGVPIFFLYGFKRERIQILGKLLITYPFFLVSQRATMRVWMWSCSTNKPIAIGRQHWSSWIPPLSLFPLKPSDGIEFLWLQAFLPNPHGGHIYDKTLWCGQPQSLPFWSTLRVAHRCSDSPSLPFEPPPHGGSSVHSNYHLFISCL